jgi:hypothetical protein
MNAIDKPMHVRILQVADVMSNLSCCLNSADYPMTIANLRDNAEALREIAAELQRLAPEREPSFGDMHAAIRDATTATELAAVWTGTAPMRWDMPDTDHLRLMGWAFGRLLAIEARHEGDGK